MLGGNTRKAVRGVLLDLAAGSGEREEAVQQALDGVAEFAAFNTGLAESDFVAAARRAWGAARQPARGAR